MKKKTCTRRYYMINHNIVKFSCSVYGLDASISHKVAASTNNKRIIFVSLEINIFFRFVSELQKP